MTCLHTRVHPIILWVFLLPVLLLASCGKPTLESINLEPASVTLTVGQTQQLRATGLDTKGKPMKDLAFTWAADGSSGRIDANGLFTAVQPGTATVRVTSGTVVRTVTITVERPKVARLTTSDVPTALTAGQQTTVTVTVQSAAGQGIAEVQVLSQPTSPDTAVVPDNAVTDANGQATFTITLAQRVSANQVQFKADAEQTSVTIHGRAGAPAVIQLTASATTVVVGEEVQLLAHVHDASGNPVPDATVQFATISEGTAATPNQATTDVQGNVSTAIKTSTKAGMHRVRATVAGLPPQDIDITGRAGAPAQVSLQADATDTVATGLVMLRILVQDRHGNGVPDVAAAIIVTPQDTVVEASVSTDATGSVETPLKTSAQAGANVVEVVVANVPAAQLTVTGHPATTLSVTPQTATIDILGSQRFRATISDARGHSTTVTPTWKVVGQAGTVARDGTFTARELGSDVLMATYAELSAGAQLTVVPGVVAVIQVSPPQATMVSGMTQQFDVDALNAHQYPLEITPTWSVTNDIGTVDSSGLFTATKAGEGEVVVSADGKSGRARVKVSAGELASITATPERVVLHAGQELQLQAQGRDAAGNSVAIQPIWSLAMNLGELDPTTGVFRARHAGTGHIRVEAGPRPIVTEIPVEVTPAALEKVEIQPSTLTISAGEEFAFTATGYDAFGNAIPVTPVWELTADLGTLTVEGTLKAQRAGAALVRATVATLTGQASVIIRPGKLAALSLDPAGPLVMAAGESVPLALTGQDGLGNLVAVTPTWSQSEPLGTLSDDGIFRAEKVGMTAVTAQSGEISATVKITIHPGKLAKIALAPVAPTILAGETLTFTATGLDAYNNAVPIHPTWRVTDDIGEVTPAGKFKALQAVSGQVVATAEGISGSARVTVQPGPLTLLKVSPEALSLTAGDTAEITVVGYDAFGNPVPAAPVWQITEGLGTVSRDGIFTAQKAGEGRVVVVVGHLAAVISLQVSRGEVATLRVSPSPSRVASGTQQQFSVEGFDRGGNPVPVQVAWEVQGNIGAIDAATGLFTGGVADTGSVMARAGTLQGNAEVVVEPGEVTSLRVTPESATLVAGAQLELHTEAFDAAGNRSAKKPMWTVTDNLGIVSESGVFQARRAGTGQLVAQLGKAQQAVSIQIQAAPLASITLVPASLTIKAGAKQHFTASGADAFGNPVPIEPTWSLQGGIGTIDPVQGTLEALTAGAGTVVAVMGRIAGLATVSVEASSASRLELRPRRLTLAAGEKGTFTATAFDRFNNRTTADITWSLNAPVGEIVGGEVQARQTGTAEVLARIGDIMARAEVEVQPGAVTRLQVIPRSLDLASGLTQQFRALGYDAYDNMQEVAVTWSLTGDIGHLKPTGLFTAGVKGQGQITARFGELSTQVDVTVVPGAVQRLLLSPRRAELPATSSQSFTVTGFDAAGNAQAVTVQWAVTQGIGKLDAAGQLTAMHVGTGTVVAYGSETLVGTSEVRVTPGPVALLFVTPQPTALRAGQSTQFLAQGFDAYRNSLPTVAPQWEVFGNIGSIDPTSGVFTAKQMGWGKVTAKVNDKRGEADVVVEPGMPDAEQSRLVSSRVLIPADGKTSANITILVRDQFGNAVTGARVTLISNREDHIDQPAPSNDQGVAVGRIRSGKAGQSEISAVVESVRISNSLRLSFNQPGASG